MPLSRDSYVNLLRSQKGYKEGANNYQKFSPETAGLGWSQNQPWCHVFASWGADELGDRGALPITASCLAGVKWFKERSRWTEYPVLGGLFYLGETGGTHVGVVYAYDDTYIYTIEGNTNTNGSANGDGVYERKRPRRGAGSPYGYGVPSFAERTVSADPALGGTKSASVPLTAPKPPQEDPLPTPADVFNYKITTPEGKQVTVADALAWMDHRHNVTFAELQELKAESAAIREQLAQILGAVTAPARTSRTSAK